MHTKVWHIKLEEARLPLGKQEDGGPGHEDEADGKTARQRQKGKRQRQKEKDKKTKTKRQRAGRWETWA